MGDLITKGMFCHCCREGDEGELHPTGSAPEIVVVGTDFGCDCRDKIGCDCRDKTLEQLHAQFYCMSSREGVLSEEYCKAHQCK